MTWAAMRAEILADTHSLVSSTDVDRKIAESCRFHRSKRMWFSERTFTFQLTASKSSYAPGDGPPPDLVEIVSNTLWVLIGGSNDQRLPVMRVTNNDFDTARQPSTTDVDTPQWWTWQGNMLRLYPVPNSSTDVIEGRYVTDVSVPVVKYEGGAFVFYSADATRKLSADELSNWANDWVDPRGAYHLIRTRAMHLLYKETLRDAEAADTHLAAWLEQAATLEDETEIRTAGAMTISPSLLGDGAEDWWY